MKWTNKGHELDEYANEVVRLFDERKGKVYLFGAGLIGGDTEVILERYQCFGGYIDNNEKKQAEGVNGHKVLSLKQYTEEGTKGIIVITADRKNIPAIERQLTKEGYVKGMDFFSQKEFMHKFFPVLSLYRFGLLYVDLVQICLTERCTLKCRDCAHGCFAVGADCEDLSLEMAMKSADSFFGKVDVAREFVLIGGEPLLYKELAEIIGYIGKKYRSKMSIYSIVTNGTIIPGQDVLDMCREHNVLIRISDYSETLKWIEDRQKRLMEKLEENGVSYILEGRSLQWMDYGFQTFNRDGGENELIKVFDECQTPCREIRGSKYYYCVMARSVSENLGFEIGQSDYLDFDDLSDDPKKTIMEFESGYSEKGYLDMCARCRGIDAEKYIIPAAVQI